MNSETNEIHVIKSLIHERVEAIKWQDVDKAVAHYSENLILFDLIGELSNVGVQAAKNRLTEWFSTMQKLVNYEVEIVDIMANADIAYCNSFNHIEAITKDGRQLDMWWRETLGWQKQNNKWLITTAHSSVPFDGPSGKASLGLKPAKELTGNGKIH